MRSAALGSKERAGRVPVAGSVGGETAEATRQQGVRARAAGPSDEHRGSPLAAEPACVAAAWRPDVEDPIADAAPGVVHEEAAMVPPADVQLDVAAEREQLRVRGDDPFA